MRLLRIDVRSNEKIGVTENESTCVRQFEATSRLRRPASPLKKKRGKGRNCRRQDVSRLRAAAVEFWIRKDGRIIEPTESWASSAVRALWGSYRAEVTFVCGL